MNTETMQIAKEAIEGAASLKGMAIGAGNALPPAYVVASKLNHMDPLVIVPLITSFCISLMTGYLVYLNIKAIKSKNKSK